MGFVTAFVIGILIIAMYLLFGGSTQVLIEKMKRHLFVQKYKANKKSKEIWEEEINDEWEEEKINEDKKTNKEDEFETYY